VRHLSTLPRWLARPVAATVVAAALVGGVATAGPASAARATAGQVSASATASSAPAFTWHSLPLTGGWKSASKSNLVTGTPGWALVNGTVYLRGAITQQSGSNDSYTFATLPAAARPAHNLYINVYTSNEVAGIVYIGANGIMEAYAGNYNLFTSLAAISYPAAAVKESKLSLQNGWTSSQSVYGTGDPSYVVRGGVVYLSGSAHNAASKPSHVLAVLPSAARPKHLLYIQAYTYGGGSGTGWLEVLPTGQVEAFGSSAAAYTSLAGVSFPAASAVWRKLTLSGWTSGATKFHTAAPSYAIIGGVVYLDGSLYGPSAANGLWAFLPAGVKTAKDVLEIEVTTGPGHPGDLGITDSLGLIGSNPFSDAKAFASLSGVTYPQSS
jgi:hypothetical protein